MWLHTTFFETKYQLSKSKLNFEKNEYSTWIAYFFQEKLITLDEKKKKRNPIIKKNFLLFSLIVFLRP